MEENLIFIEIELDKKDMIFGNILTLIILFSFHQTKFDFFKLI